MPHEQNSDANNGGYTKAVDLWSLGCVTVVLLTGGYPFFEPGSSEYSGRLASTCNLEALEMSQAWRDVGSRPKAFVRRLLILDERQRMTAKESLTHEWFTNDVHKTDFEELYGRAIKHWRPRMPKEPVIELIEADSLKNLPFLQGISPDSSKNRRRGRLPIDPPYKPFPRRLHSQIFPKRKIPKFNSTMSDDVKAAIERNWNFDKNSFAVSSVAEGDLPKPRASKIDAGSNSSSTDKLHNKSLLHSTTALPALSKKPRLQPLRPKVASTSTNAVTAPETGCGKAQSTTDTSDCAKSKGKDIAPARRAYSPTAWEEDADVMSSAPNNESKLMLQNKPVTPRPSKTSRISNNGTGLSPASWKNGRTLNNSRHFGDHSSCETIRKSDNPVISVDEEARLVDQHSSRRASDSPSSDGQKRSDHPIRSFSEARSDKRVLASEPEESAESSHPFPNALRVFSDRGDAPPDVVRPETTTTALRLNSPTNAIRDILGMRSSNIKKRRSHSVFDVEEDVSDSAPQQSKKAKFDQENVNRNCKPTSIHAAFPQTEIQPGHAESATIEVENTPDQTCHTGDLYLPRI